MTPTREQIATMVQRAKYGLDASLYAKVQSYDIADALLREYEIRVKEEKNG